MSVQDTDAITVGLATIHVCDTVGKEFTDPTVTWYDVGSVRDGELEVSQEVLEHKSGLPQVIDKRVIIERGARFTATWEEVRAENILRAVGISSSSSSVQAWSVTESGGSVKTDYKRIEIGNSEAVLEIGVHITHDRPDEKIFNIHFWKASPGGTFTFGFSPTDWVGYSVEMVSVYDWCHSLCGPLGYLEVASKQTTSQSCA